MSYGTHFKRGLGVREDAMAGAAKGMSIEALIGDGDMVTVFDDFNNIVGEEAFDVAGLWEALGWELTIRGAAIAHDIGMNPAGLAVDRNYDSSIRLNAGTAANTGGNAQLDRVNNASQASGESAFPHIWIPENSASATLLDNTVLVFACRVGFQTTDAAGDWDGGCFIGWAEAGDTTIMTLATGAITVAGDGPLMGFHIPFDGSIDGISQRDATAAFAAGTNFTELVAAGGVDAVAANGIANVTDVVWFDLALRATVTDMSDDNANGRTEFFYRRVPQLGAIPGTHENPPGSGRLGPWTRHPTVLENQTPNNDVALVPTIEVINGATEDSDVFVDWWLFGQSRFSRR